jgi:hypothetical protein
VSFVHRASSILIFCSLLCLGSLLPVLAPAVARAADPATQAGAVPTAPAFDAAGAAAVADELVASLSAMREAERSIPTRPPTLQRAQAAFSDNLKLLESTAQRLAARLRNGATSEETLPLLRRIRTVSRDADANARRAKLSGDELVPFEASRALVARLDPFFEATTLPAAPAAD